MRMLFLILIAAMSLAGAGALRAEDYPAKPVTLIVPFTPGGPADSAGRIIARALEHQSGRPFIVENIGGAGSTIGVTRAANATPDGYSLLLASSSALVMAPHLYANLRYDPFTSLLPIGQITEAPFIVLVNSASKFRSYADLLDYGKANPGKMNFATPGLGTVQHVTVELMMDVGGFSATHVPFKGAAPTVTALLGGEVDFIVETLNSADALVAAGKLRPLAMTGIKRLTQMPDVPTFQELGQKDVEMRSWFALIAPKGVSAPIMARLEAMLNAALTSEDTRKAFRAAGFEPVPMPPAEVSTMIRREHEKFGTIIRAKNIKLGHAPVSPESTMLAGLMGENSVR